MDKLDRIIQENIHKLLNEDTQQDLQKIYQLCHEIVQWSKANRSDKNTNIEQRSQQIASIWSNNKNVVKYCDYINKNTNKGKYNRVIGNVNDIVEEINQCLQGIYKNSKNRENPLWHSVKNKAFDATDRLINGWFGMNVPNNNDDDEVQKYEKFK